MKEELLNKFFEKLLQYADGVEQFTSNQAPKYVEEMLAYGTIATEMSMYFFGVFGILFILSACYLLFKAITDDDGFFIGFILVLLPTAIFCGISLGDYLDLKKIEIAPRVYIVDQLKGGNCNE